MSRFLVLIAAAALTGTSANAATYSAKPAVQPDASRIIARDISWSCGPAVCLGSTEESRPAILCQGLAKRAGRLESFSADGRRFTTAELDKCNAFAKGGRPAAAGTTATTNAN